MKDFLKVLGIMCVVLLVTTISIYSLGWFDVGYTKTIGKAQQNADREVFEESNSFTKAKRQEIIKYYKEWQEADTPEDKQAIEFISRQSLADFDEDKFITDPKLLSWIKTIKY